MGNEAASLIATEQATNQYTYESIETTATIAITIEHLTTHYFNSVALVTITLDFDGDGKATPSRFITDVYTTTTYLIDSLRPLVRKTDVVFLLNSTLHFLLLGANLQGGEIVQTRLWEALLWRIHNIGEGEMLRPVGISIGYSAYPVPCTNSNGCIATASEALHCSNFISEKSTRKTAARSGQLIQPSSLNDELPTLARKLGIPYLSLLPKKPPQRIQQLVNPKLAQELRCYPIGRERNILTVAMLDPQDASALQRLQQETGLRIFPVLTHPQALQSALELLL
jgi:Type II secretion system (T2SS), protein E, N-terminal domain